MSLLKNKIVFITGASSGIGAASAQQFAAAGANVILAARRLDRVQALAKQLASEYDVQALPVSLDVCDSAAVISCIEGLDERWSEIDVLLNNAGLAKSSKVMPQCELSDWDAMIDTNLKGLLYVIHAVLPVMMRRNSGHIINISSIAGHHCYQGGNVYSATKHAVRSLSQSLRIDLLGKAIRVTDIAPGAVNTEFSTVRWDDKAKADQFYEGFTPLQAEDIAESVLFCASRPLHVDVSELVIYPTAQASPNHLSKDGAKPSSLLFD